VPASSLKNNPRNRDKDKRPSRPISTPTKGRNDKSKYDQIPTFL
jgi:hypothetical protein